MRMEIGARFGSVQNPLDGPQRQCDASHTVHRDDMPCRLALHRRNQIPIALASEPRFRATEFLQRPKRWWSYLPASRKGRRRNIVLVRRIRNGSVEPYSRFSEVDDHSIQERRNAVMLDNLEKTTKLLTAMKAA